MTEFVLSLFYFLRPVSYAAYRFPIGGLQFLEVFAIISFGLLLILGVASLHRLKLTPTDMFIVMFSVWCIGAFFAYFEKAHVAELTKFLLPFFTYSILRIAVRTRERYLRLLWWMIVGTAVPAIMTAALVLSHKGVYVQNYWTGLYRFTGVYPNPHDLGHSMTFVIMTIVIYWVLRSVGQEDGAPALQFWRKLFMVALGMIALFCLYKSYVRTAYLGLLLFGLIYLFFYSKKLFVAAVATFSLSVVVLWSLWVVIFHDVADVAAGKSEAEMVASGRPYIWKHNIEIFSNLTIDRQLAGVGFGNRLGINDQRFRDDNVWNSHNDYLDVVMQTGVVGFIMFMAIQILLLRHILALEGRERWVFLSLYITVAFMNFASNSYIARFGLGQSFYMVIIFAEAARQRSWRQRQDQPVVAKAEGPVNIYQAQIAKPR